MSELDEVAQAIYDQHSHFFPLNRVQAVALARANLGEDESPQLVDGLADALMELNP